MPGRALAAGCAASSASVGTKEARWITSIGTCDARRLESAIVESAIVESAIVESAIVESAIVGSAIVESATRKKAVATFDTDGFWSADWSLWRTHVPPEQARGAESRAGFSASTASERVVGVRRVPKAIFLGSPDAREHSIR